MTVPLGTETQQLVTQLLRAEEREGHHEAIDQIAALPAQERDKIEHHLIERLDAGNYTLWARPWALTALSKIGGSEGKKRVLEHTALQNEPEKWARHFALLNAANFVPFPEQEIKDAINDPDELVQATALRLLVTKGHDQYEDTLLDMLYHPRYPYARWAAARALRNRARPQMQELPEHLEGALIQPLTEIAANPYIDLDARWEAVETLASYVHRKAQAASELSDLLKKDENKDSTFRRYYLKALHTLDQPQESQEALLQALQDPDAQIRSDAADVLKEMLGAKEGIELIVPLALKSDQDTHPLVEALRHIDSDAAAKDLREAMDSPNAEVRANAKQLLTELGGHMAAQILTDERTKALANYTAILSKADEDVGRHFRDLMRQAKAAFWLSLAMHVIVFAIGVWILIGSLNVALTTGQGELSKWIGVGVTGTASALVILLASFYRNPLRNVRGSLNALMQVNVVFLGYVRQINQIDATFKHMFLTITDFGTQQMQETVQQIQCSVKETFEQIKVHILSR